MPAVPPGAIACASPLLPNALTAVVPVLPPPTPPITTTATHHHRHHLTPCSGSARVLNNLTRDPDATKRFIADAIAIAHEQKLTGFNIDFESGPGLDTVALSAFLRVRHFPAQFPPF